MAYSYQPKEGHGLRHDPLNAIVGPRPIGWISSRGSNGALNLAPYSFFNLFSYRPPIVGFSSIGWKDSARNISETKAFVWNLATRPLAEKMNLTSAMLPSDVDEFEHAGLTPASSRLIDVPRVAESPVAFECVMTQQFVLRTKEGDETPAWMTFGEVVMIHIDEALLEDGVYDAKRARAILRVGRTSDYIEVTPDAFFEMERPG